LGLLGSEVPKSMEAPPPAPPSSFFFFGVFSPSLSVGRTVARPPSLGLSFCQICFSFLPFHLVLFVPLSLSSSTLQYSVFMILLFRTRRPPFSIFLHLCPLWRALFVVSFLFPLFLQVFARSFPLDSLLCNTPTSWLCFSSLYQRTSFPLSSACSCPWDGFFSLEAESPHPHLSSLLNFSVPLALNRSIPLFVVPYPLSTPPRTELPCLKF